MKKIAIAIDGSSASGKSTLAKDLARALEYVHIDTGAMYRAVTLFSIQNGFIQKDCFEKQKLISSLSKINIAFNYNPGTERSDTVLNGINVEKEIRTAEVSEYVSRVSAIREVREKLVASQREMAKNKGVVMDGRDIGTVVMPDAELKIFVIAGLKIRAERRFREMINTNRPGTFESVMENLQKRDYQDTHRRESPLKKAKDAVAIDNSYLSREEQLKTVLALLHQRPLN